MASVKRVFEMSEFMKEFKEKIRPKLRDSLGLNNLLAVPEPLKVSVNVGMGKIREDEGKVKKAVQSLAKLAGQKPVFAKAKKSISGFKLRKGEPVALYLTLRGKRMFDFIEKLTKVVLPRIRDFRGIDERSLDGKGNLSIAIKENIVFPEIKIDENEIFGLRVSIVSSAKDKNQGKILFEALGFPFRKKEFTSR